MRITKIVEGDFVEVKVSMGGDLNRLEPTKLEDFSKSWATQIILKEGGFVPYMQAMAGYDENCSQQFIATQKDRQVTINDISFQMNEESIAMVTGLNMKGKKWKKNHEGGG